MSNFSDEDLINFLNKCFIDELIDFLEDYPNTLGISLFKNELKKECLFLIDNLKVIGRDKKFVDKLRDLYDTELELSKSLEISNIYNVLYIRAYVLAYFIHRDDFDSFSVIVNDICRLKCRHTPSKIEVFSDLYFEVMRDIISEPNYKNMPNLRKTFSLILEDAATNRAGILVDYYQKISYQMLEDYLAIDVDNDEYYYKVLEARLGDCLEKYDNSISNSIFSLYFGIEDLYYSKILLYEDRFFYLNAKIKEIEGVSILRRDIFKCIEKFSVEMFNELNEDSMKDSFITCMDVVFDSDSYFELNNKLAALGEASKLYNCGFVDEAFSLVKSLKDEKHKKKYLGKLFSYCNNGMNLISKPKRIIDREKELYSKLDDSISYDFLDNVYVYSATVERLSESIDEAVKKERLPFNRLKNKVKRMKIFGGDF